MALPMRKSQTLRNEINNWASSLKKIDSRQGILVKKILTKVSELIASSDLKARGEISKEIEDITYDMTNEFEELMTVMELVGGIEKEIVNVTPVLNEIKHGKKLTQDFRISIKNLVKSSLDSSNIKEDILEDLRTHYSQYKEIANKIRELSDGIHQILKENIEKFNKI